MNTHNLRLPVIRYYMETRPITVWESIRRLWITWKWNRDEIYMRPVKEGEPGYDEAPFEQTVIYHRDHAQRH